MGANGLPAKPKGLVAWEDRMGRDALGRIGFVVTHDDAGNWTVGLPGTVQCLRFPADPEPGGLDAGEGVSGRPAIEARAGSPHPDKAWPPDFR